MKIIEKYSDCNFVDSAEVRTQRFKSSVYNISAPVIKFVQEKLQPGKTVVLFSGSWRFDFDATYLEASFFKDNTMSLSPNTYFVEPVGLDIRPNTSSDYKIFNEIMYNIAAQNILIIHSALFCNYQSMDVIINRMKMYQQFGPKQIILSVPTSGVHFNRLKLTANGVAQQYQAEIVDDSFILQLI